MSSLFGAAAGSATSQREGGNTNISTTAGQSSGSYASSGGFLGGRGGQFASGLLGGGGRGAGPLSQFQQQPSQIEQALGNRNSLQTALQIPQNSEQQIFIDALQRARRL